MLPTLVELSAVLAISFSVLLIYPFALYPLILRCLPTAERRRWVGTPPARIAMLIAARDEAAAIPATVMALRGAMSRLPGLDVLLFDDGSRDSTGPVLSRAAERIGDRFRVQRVVRPVGKAEALARLRPAAGDADLLVFMDANVRVTPAAIEDLVSVFKDPTVGAAAARFRQDGARGRIGRAYWKLEEEIKREETRTGSTVGCDGGLWAIRAAAFEAVPKGASDDFYPSVRALTKGWRVVSAGEVQAEEAVVPDEALFRRTSRIANGAWHAHRALVPHLRELPLLDRFKYVSHKLVRWFAGVWLFGALMAWAVFAIALGYGAAVTLAAALAVLGALIGVPPLRVAARFALAFFGTSWGILRAMFGADEPVWAPVRT